MITTLILKLIRWQIIKRLRTAHMGSDLVNHILKSLGLQETGLPKFKNPPPPPKKMEEAL